MASSRTRFDTQASGFDERAGVGAAAAEIAAAIVAVAGVGRGDVVVEIGPGTGEIGAHLAAATGRYVGIDSSLPMLERFADRAPARAGGPPPALLVQADATRPWPVRTGSARLLFASRAAHLLDVDHACAEASRVAAPGASVLVGRVQRDKEGLRNRLRSRRRALLAGHGIDAGEGRERTGRLLDALVGCGARPLDRRTVARWTVTTSVDAVIGQWDATGTLGGEPVPADVHADVIAGLRAWARAEGLESVQESETYLLEGVSLP